MTVGWVAASTRARAFVRRLPGVVGARDVARCDTWDEARTLLRSSVYGRDLAADADRLAARHRAQATTMWQLRVLAGWLPAGDAVLARLAAAPMEMADIEGHLARLQGRTAEPSIELGSLASAWPRVAAATSSDAVRRALARSVWGDPGAVDPWSVAVGLRLSWARRVHLRVPDARPWARGAAAVLVARERYGFDRDLPAPSGRVADELLGRGWRKAGSLGEHVAVLPPTARWALEGIDAPAGLWQAERAVEQRIAADATTSMGAGRFDRSVVTGAFALVLVDLRRILAAIEVAGRGRTPEERLDAVA